MDEIVQFDFPTDSPKIIKVIGVGGGGGNAVNHMYREGIHDVTFVLCNTDNQALAESPVPVKLQLGRSITQGLGAGNRPERARDAAEESIEDIRNQLNDGTKMVFITAGMGGGTGTGAAPVIARIAKEMDILTVGIVTIPFIFEGEKKIIQALDGVERIAQHVDALLVINNERLREIYADLTFMNAFGKADDTLSIAAKSIAEIITMRGTVNLDFADVKTILKDGGVAIMSTGFGEGENRVTKAIDDAQASPDAEVILGGKYDKSKGYFIYPTVIQAKKPDYITMREELFGPVLTIYVYEPDQIEETLDLLDAGSAYALTGAIFSNDRANIEKLTERLTHTAGNFYINDKPTGAVVDQQPFGGGRASGTNDKAGSVFNLLRWVSPQCIKETFIPATNYMYPNFLES